MRESWSTVAAKSLVTCGGLVCSADPSETHRGCSSLKDFQALKNVLEEWGSEGALS